MSKILKGHNVDILPTFSAKSIDLIVTDPPYALTGDGLEHGITASVAVALRLAAEKLKVGSWMVVYSATSWRSTIYMVEALRNIVSPVRTATWTKPEARTKVQTPGWQYSSVNIIAFRKGPKNRKDLPEPSKILDHISAKPIKNGRKAELPEIVAKWSMEPFIIPGGTFLDPFSGSGILTTVAEQFGMNAIGIEIQDI